MTEPPMGWSTPGDPTPPPAQGYGYGPAYGTPPSTPWYATTLPPGIVPLRPLGLGEILDGAIKVIRRYPRPTLGLAALVATISTLVSIALVLVADVQLIPDSDSDELAPDFGSSVNVGSAGGGLVGYLAGIVLTGALVVVVGKAVQGLPAPSSEVWQAVRPRLLPLLGLSLLTGLIVAGPIGLAVVATVLLVLGSGAVMLVLGIPLVLLAIAFGVYAYTRLSLAPAALVLEKTTVRAAMRRSSVLVRGTWWRLFGILLLATLIGGVLTAIVSLPITLIGGVLLVTGNDDGTGFLIAQQVAGGLASVLVAPFVAGVTALLYVDRRMRAEGLDVALQAATGTGPAL